MSSTESHIESMSQEGDQAWWNLLGTLYRWRRFIIIVTSVMAVASVVISLLLPNWFKASSRLLLPASASGGIASALLGDISSAAQSLLGGGGGDYIRYMAILNSRSVMDEVIEHFDLIMVYDLAEEEFPLQEARSTLGDNVDFVIDQEFDFMSIEVLDQDPQRAADMSNFFVERLDEINNRLSKQTAGNFRQFVEERYAKSQSDRDALLDSLAAFQREYGVIDLEAQTAAFFTQLAELRAGAVQVEIQLESLKAQFGETNRQVQSLQSLADAADTRYQEALNGSEAVLPVSRSAAPEMVKRYLNLMMERTIQERILELVAPMLEQARFEEERISQTVQVVDAAVAPVEKFKPKRSIICIAATLSGFILAILFALLIDWWNRRHAYFADRLREAASAS
ncbi:MAG: Wzz/FepE/Etk N-terminal domain-containing protein [Bacteroidetes bacterium]|nr:Wzz/FepE/Etk N-terminal domain-containing protein [Bacteroidota bacterium]